MYLADLMGDSYKEDMTLDEVSAFLEKQHEDSNKTVKKYKDMLSKANSEAADYKRKLKAKMSDQEVAEQERNQELEALRNRCAELEKSQRLADETNRFLELGYPKELAVQSASALVEGNSQALFEVQAKFIDAVKKSAVETALKDTIKPTTAYAEKSVDYAKLAEEAIANKDSSAAAYYTRLAQQGGN